MAGKPNKPKEYAKEETGRPSKFTPERCAAIIDAISHRIPYEYAAESNGISEATLYVWLDTAKKHLFEGIESDYTVFLEGVKRAEMTKIRNHLDIISERPERWQADAWILERRWHKHFSPNAGLHELNKRLDRVEQGEPSNGSANEKEDENEERKRSC